MQADCPTSDVFPGSIRTLPLHHQRHPGVQSPCSVSDDMPMTAEKKQNSRKYPSTQKLSMQLGGGEKVHSGCQPQLLNSYFIIITSSVRFAGWRKPRLYPGFFYPPWPARSNAINLNRPGRFQSLTCSIICSSHTTRIIKKKNQHSNTREGGRGYLQQPCTYSTYVFRVWPGWHKLS